MDDNKCGTSSTNRDNNQTIATPAEDPGRILSANDDEEIRQFQTTFSDMIDHTCSNSYENIGEFQYNSQDTFRFLFRSIIPAREILQQDFEPESEKNLFNFETEECLKYSFKVLDRRTNRLTIEHMPVYHKYGMRLLFRGPLQRELLTTNAIRNFFARETLRLGKAFNEPKSRKHIQTFIKIYQINLNELLEPNIQRYFTFNEFFYRKLKVDARPIDNRDDPCVVVSAADCRLILFDNISEATRIWIKGHQFSLEHLFEDEVLAKEFENGSIAVFRLSPADYHRFHSPISGILGENMKTITGTYYTVNPMAIREQLDVLTRNQRTMITIENSYFEKVAFVAIGALFVGSVNFTAKPRQSIEKGDELGVKVKIIYLGYFAYGGSTIVIVFKAGMIKWDDDLQHNSKNSMETLVRMGEHIGQRTSQEERQQYLLGFSNDSNKNGTVTQILRFFPNMPNLNNFKV
ncbi:unnamed protein product [Rotaria magnacalcarata]|uniref:phosphatidylserine decarboxylase n=4 Tax=Rotaria magnacalcarata TaxID=392030 RepID=A0A820B4J7_9BILA|nr:unnamed protein product [Rotaria magnacalcarata]CAF4202372.1 unnamed protein product [Rotaria magnacalcarata]